MIWWFPAVLPGCVPACVCAWLRSCPTGWRIWSGLGPGMGSGAGCWSSGCGRSGRREPRGDPRARRRNRRGVTSGNVLAPRLCGCPSRHCCSWDSPWNDRTAYQALRGTTDKTGERDLKDTHHPKKTSGDLYCLLHWNTNLKYQEDELDLKETVPSWTQNIGSFVLFRCIFERILPTLILFLLLKFNAVISVAR